MKNRKPVFFIILIIAMLMVYTAIFGVSIPIGSAHFNILGAPEMRYGIDIRGGVDAVFQPDGLDRKATSSELEAARTIINTRLDQKNILDRDVTIDKSNGYLIVRFPWKANETDFNPEDAMAELGETALLTFRDSNDKVLLEGSTISESKAVLDQDTHQYVVSLVFDEKGTKLFSKATQDLIGKTLNIYMDETLVQAVTVSEHIPSGKAQISNIGTFEEAKELSDKINSGSLPFSMITKNHSTISPTLGAGALNVMVVAAIIAFCIICFLLILYYRLPGVVACVALLIQISGQILALSIPQITLTLTGIAGIILSIGMGVDANVIISERISEELKSGKTVRSAIASGFKNAFSSVFDGNITVMIVAVILMLFGSGSLLSFAYSLLTGIFFNFVAGVTASRLMIRSLSQFDFLSKPWLYTCLSRRVTLLNNKIIGFYKKRGIFFAVSFMIMAMGIISIFINGVHLDIQFKGGALLKYSYVGEIDAGAASDVSSKLLGRPVTAQLTSNLASGEKRLVINIAGKYGMDAKDQLKFDDALKEKFPNAELSSLNPQWSKHFLERSSC